MMINKLIEKKKKSQKFTHMLSFNWRVERNINRLPPEEPRFPIWAVGTYRHAFGCKSPHSHRVLHGVVGFKTATDINKRFAVQKTLRK